MPIKRDLSSLPVRDTEPWVGRSQDKAPTKHPTVGPALAQAWFDSRIHDDNLPTALPEAGPFRGSWGGKCSQAISYSLSGVPMSDPPTIAGHWRMDLGSLVHAELQDEIEKVTPGAIREYVVDFSALGVGGSLRMDILNPVLVKAEGSPEQMYEAVEIKTINGFGYKMTATDYPKTGPQGPRTGHVIQLALEAAGAAAMGEYEIVGGRLVYLALENVSPDLAKHIGTGGEEAQFCAEWYFPLEQLQAIAAQEIERWQRLLGQRSHTPGTEEVIVQPTAPLDVLGDYTEITVLNPKTGAGVDQDGKGAKYPLCAYCDWQSVCIRDFETIRNTPTKEKKS